MELAQYEQMKCMLQAEAEYDRQVKGATHRFLHTHRVLLRLPLTTADEKLSKVIASW